MNRKEKIDSIIGFLDENSIKIIETEHLGAVIVDAELSLDEECDEEYNDLIEKGLSEDDVKEFKKFLNENNLMMIRDDVIRGVSFENLEYYGLEESGLFKDEEEKAPSYYQGI